MFFILSTKQNAGVLGWPLKLLNCKCYKVHLTHEWIAYFCALTGTPFWLFMHHLRFSYGNQGYKAAVWWQHCSLELGPNCPYCFSHGFYGFLKRWKEYRINFLNHDPVHLLKNLVVVCLMYLLFFVWLVFLYLRLLSCLTSVLQVKIEFRLKF